MWFSIHRTILVWPNSSSAALCLCRVTYFVGWSSSFLIMWNAKRTLAILFIFIKSWSEYNCENPLIISYSSSMMYFIDIRVQKNWFHYNQHMKITVQGNFILLYQQHHLNYSRVLSVLFPASRPQIWSQGAFNTSVCR